VTRLFAKLESFGDAVALVDGRSGAEVTYGQLVERADAWASQHPGRGLVFLEADNHVDATVAYVACVRSGRPVFLAAAGTIDKTPHLVDTYQPSLLVRSRDDRSEAEQRGDGPVCHPDLGVLLSTSGSTGSPKLVRLSHTNIKANSDSIAEYLQLAPGERAITGLKPNYSYGMSIVNSHLDNGHALVLTHASVTEDAFWATFAEQEVTSLAGVPFTYETLARVGRDLSSFAHLRYATQAGGKLHADLVRHFADQLSAAGRRFYVMYGQTEAAPRISFLPPDRASAHARSIGIPVPGGTIRLEDDDGTPIDAPDVPGILVYEGPNVMMGYALHASDLAEPAGPPVLRTGDIATFDPAGLFYIVGRAKRFIKPFGVRVNLDDVEQKLKGIEPLAVATGTDDELLLVLPVSAAARAAEARAMAIDTLGLPPHALRVETLDEIPRLPTGKTDYKALLSQLGPQPDTRPAWRRFVAYFFEEVADILGLRERAWSSIAELFRVLIGADEVSDEHTFSDLGDSMSYVQVRVELEQLLGHLPQGWERMTVAELESMRSAGAL